MRRPTAYMICGVLWCVVGLTAASAKESSAALAGVVLSTQISSATPAPFPDMQLPVLPPELAIEGEAGPGKAVAVAIGRDGAIALRVPGGDESGRAWKRMVWDEALPFGLHDGLAGVTNGVASVTADARASWSRVRPVINALRDRGRHTVALRARGGRDVPLAMPTVDDLLDHMEAGTNAMVVAVDADGSVWIDFLRTCSVEHLTPEVLARHAGGRLPVLCIDDSLSFEDAIRLIATVAAAQERPIWLRPRLLCAGLPIAAFLAPPPGDPDLAGLTCEEACRALRGTCEDLDRLRRERLDTALREVSLLPRTGKRIALFDGPYTPPTSATNELRALREELCKQPVGEVFKLTADRQDRPEQLLRCAEKACLDIALVELARTGRYEMPFRRDVLNMVLGRHGSADRAVERAEAGSPCGAAGRHVAEARRLSHLARDLAAQNAGIASTRSPYEGMGFPFQTGAKLGLSTNMLAGCRLPAERRARPCWLSIDEWWVVGPFPNPERCGLREPLGPEKDGMKAWVSGKGRAVPMRRVQCNVPPVVLDTGTPETVWYAYARVWSPHQQNIWHITGSENYGCVWLNGDLIASLGITSHPWMPDRWYQKVALRKGANDILFKTEDLTGVMSFSFMVYLEPEN